MPFIRSHTSITENAKCRTFDVQYIERHDAELFDVLSIEVKLTSKT